MQGIISAIRRHPWRSGFGALAVVLLGAAVANRELISLLLSPEPTVDLSLPVVTPLTAGAGETVYLIDASRSKATVEVDEELAGARTTATLTTSGIAGSFAVGADPAQSRVGEMAVNVMQLRSDNSLRDKVLHHDYLESHTNPEVRLDNITVEGPVAAPAPGAPATFTLRGDLTVKQITKPVSFTAEAGRDGDEITATATGTVQLSDFGVGPITKIGLVRTGDDARLTLQLTAVDAADFTPPATVEVRTAGDDDPVGGPSYSTQVAPILQTNCASCHQTGQVGAEHWKLDTAGDARADADGVAVVTKARYMPPWPASDAGVPLQHTRRLTDDQIATLRDWAAAGAPLDVPPATPVTPTPDPTVVTPRSDVKMALIEPYNGESNERDDYRCFVLDPKFTTESFVTGYTFEPDRLDVVHHALIYRAPAKALELILQADAKDAGSGWRCGSGMGPKGSEELIAGWVPGQMSRDFGDGVGYRFNPGDVLVAQVHYHYEDDRPADRSRMSLEVAPPGEPVTALHTTEYLAPVELPCPAGRTEPLCDRSAALADVAQRFGPAGAGIANGLNRLCRTTPEQVAAASDGTLARTTCDLRVRDTGDIVDVLGHMHQYGLSYRMTLHPDSEQATVLLDIPRWDFNWQLNYQPVTPVPVTAGDTVRVECSWDRSLRPTQPMRYLVFAEGTDDEMCFSTITVRPTP